MPESGSIDDSPDGSCPEIAALARGAEDDRADAAAYAAIAAHLEGCEPCRVRLAEMRESEDFLRRLRPGETAPPRLTPEGSRGAGGRPASGHAPEIAEHPGSVVGRYTLLEQIGEGGFGVVFSARQTEPVSRRVALKILKPGMDSRQVLARFEAERHTLALMDHPNIAGVLDAGVTATGRPYFVMELVEGVPITRHCDDARLTIRERLELFRAVCAAVQHAHQKGIIHRDIKPSNVMVTVKDGVAVPKVIDFGIAKATDQHLAEQAAFTRLGQFIGTPEYTSPEQAAGPSDDIDTRSDVYSLGVLLYELLTGATPLDPERLRSAGLAEMQRVIREGETPRPSTRLSTMGGLEAVAASRRIDPRRLALQLRGELDWILLKTLEKDRARRYDTVAALAEDLRRYLENEPVRAGPPSAAYRVRKFARRNRAAVATAAVLGVIVVTGLAGTSIGLVRATEAERERAAEAAWANQVASVQAGRFVSDRMLESHLLEWEARLITLRTRLPDDDSRRIEQESLFAVWGWNAYCGKEVHERLELEAQQRIGWAAREAIPELASTRVEPSAFVIWPDSRPRLSPETMSRAQTWGPRVRSAYDRAGGVLAASDPLWIALVDAVIRWEAIQGASPSTLDSLYDTMVQACDAIHGEDSGAAMETLCEWAEMLATAGRYSEGLSIVDEYARRRIRSSITATLRLHLLHKRLFAAFLGYEQSPMLEQFMQVYADDTAKLLKWNDRGYTIASYDRGRWLCANARYAEAEQVFADLLKSFVRDESSQQMAVDAAYRLGVCRFLLGRPEDAEPVFRETSRTLETFFSRYKYQSDAWLARCLRELGRYEEAEPLLLSSHRWCIEHPWDAQELRDSVNDLIDLYTRWGKPDLAAQWDETLATLPAVPDRSPQNLDFEQASPGESFPGWRKGAGAQAALTTERPAHGLQCARLDPPSREGSAQGRPFSALFQTIDSGPFRGKRIRFTASVRTDCAAPEDRVQLYISVEPREVDGLIVLNNMDGWPIRSSEWKRYGVVCRIYEDARSITIGAMALGNATAWLDDVRIEVVDPDSPDMDEVP